jgi:predicted ATPase
MHNLPAHLPLLVGREVELDQLRPLLGDRHARLLTLTGPGGCGKTRLALELAHQSVERFSGGVWFIELATLAEPTLVPQAIAAVLGVREEPGSPLADTLLGALRSRSALLVLDNCEHLVEACAMLCETLLRGCPELRILATGRERLGVTNEVIRQVAPLAVPDPDHRLVQDEIADYAGVRLFVERARAAHADLRLTPHTSHVVGQICARLDGMPLAIELAAARLRVLGPEQILERLDDSLHLLAGGSRTAPRRQQTLEATLDWSHALLTNVEQVIFRRLAVFAGGCDLQAAEAVCAGDGTPVSDVLDALAHLADKSLVQVENRSSGARYRFLAPVRQYALERLIDSGEDARARDRHLRYCSANVLEADVECAAAVVGGPTPCAACGDWKRSATTLGLRCVGRSPAGRSRLGCKSRRHCPPRAMCGGCTPNAASGWSTCSKRQGRRTCPAPRSRSDPLVDSPSARTITRPRRNSWSRAAHGGSGNLIATGCRTRSIGCR